MSLNFTLNKIPEGTSTSDTTDPTPGSNGTLSTSSINSGGFDVDYTKATDNESDPENLRYYLYTSTSDNVDTVSNAEANGTLQNSGGTLDVSTLTASSLSSSTTYYFNIVVEDEAGNKAAYTSNNETTTSSGGSGLDSQAGDEAALETLYISTNGGSWTDSTGWSSNMSGALDGGSTPYGITTELINSEYRVTKIELKDNNLTGSIDFTEIGNLKEMTLFAVSFNSLDTQFPQAIGDCTSLVYLYLSRSDTAYSKTIYPHEQIQNSSLDYIHPGKTKGDENNVISGPIPTTIGNLSNLEFFVCSYTDTNATSFDGITDVPQEIWDCSNLIGLQLYTNRNINASNNTLSFPSSISHMTQLKNLSLVGGSKDDAFLTGSYPSDMDQLTTLTVLEVKNETGLSGFPDLQNSTGLTVLLIGGTDISGSFPSWVLDNTVTDLDMVSFAWPSGSGLTGSIPEVANGMGQLSAFQVTDHSLSGSIPASLWENVTNITNTNFSHNSFTSIGRTDLTILSSSIRNLRWSNNDIGGEPIPTLDWGNVPSLTRAYFDDNKYVPRDVAPEYDNYEQVVITENGGTFRIGNQKPFGSGSDYDSGTGIIDFSDHVSHVDNTYTWYKDGSVVSGETSRSIDTGSHGAGDYHLEVDNSKVGPRMGIVSSITITV